MIIMAWDYHREGNILISLTLLKKKKSINSNTLILLLFASFLTQLSFRQRLAPLASSPLLPCTPRSHRRPGCGFSSLPLSHYMDLSGVLRHPLCIFMVLIEAGYQASLAESQPHEECLTNVNQEQEKWRVTGGKGWG